MLNFSFPCVIFVLSVTIKVISLLSLPFTVTVLAPASTAVTSPDILVAFVLAGASAIVVATKPNATINIRTAFIRFFIKTHLLFYIVRAYILHPFLIYKPHGNLPAVLYTIEHLLCHEK